MWNVLHSKEKKYRRQSGYLDNHPQLHCKMRTILLDWLIEVRVNLASVYIKIWFIEGSFLRDDGRLSSEVLIGQCSTECPLLE